MLQLTLKIVSFGIQLFHLPNLFIISGYNGAGKTTASFTIFTEILKCKEFVNADEIAKGISPFQPETVAFQAARIMLKRIEELLISEVDFAIETTLTTLSYINTIKFAKLKGYTIKLIYLWLENVDLAIERVKIRVSEGGHSIPEPVIIRRYFRGIKNLNDRFISLCDYWIFIDNSKRPFNFVAEGFGDKQIKIHNVQVWEIINKLSNEVQ